ncbi:unnamed protein product [Amoebophrya sp. A25]|nr:unnamed protein product [Amoebophrya sp. A25]|eukprot:GSA25T00016604001.1
MSIPSPDALGEQSGSSAWEFVCKTSEFDEHNRCHRRLRSGRFVTVVAHKDRYHCIDSICYHMGGPLGVGDIEDVKVPRSATGSKSAGNSELTSGQKPRTGGNLSELFAPVGGLIRNFFGGSSSSTEIGGTFHGSPETFTPQSSGTGQGRAHGSRTSPGTAPHPPDGHPMPEEPVILCPWHYHKISLTTGKKFTEGLKPHRDRFTGAFTMKKCGLQESPHAFQQVHVAKEEQGKIFVVECGKEEAAAGLSGWLGVATAPAVRDCVGLEPPPVAKANTYAFDSTCAGNLAGRPQIHSRQYRAQSAPYSIDSGGSISSSGPIVAAPIGGVVDSSASCIGPGGSMGVLGNMPGPSSLGFAPDCSPIVGATTGKLDLDGNCQDPMLAVPQMRKRSLEDDPVHDAPASNFVSTKRPRFGTPPSV